MIVILENSKTYKIIIQEKGIDIIWRKEEWDLGISGKIREIHSNIKTHMQHYIVTNDDEAGMSTIYSLGHTTSYGHDLGRELLTFSSKYTFK